MNREDFKYLVIPTDNGFRDITLAETLKYELIEITTYSDLANNRLVFIHGKCITRPPQDGYEYRRCDGLADKEYKWERLIPEGELILARDSDTS